MIERVSGIILAGGQGQRLGGLDKGLVPLGGAPLISHVIERLAPQVESIIISANRNLDDYRALGHVVVSDSRGPWLGPLAGIATALGAITAELALAVPCDTPFLPWDLRQRLQAELEKRGADIAIAHDGQRLQPMCMLLRRTLLPLLEAELAAGHLKVQRWMIDQRHCIATFDDATAFTNINGHADLTAAEARLAACPSGG